MKNSFKNKYLLIVLFFLLTIVFFVQKSYSYFDLLETKDNVSIMIGSWGEYIKKATAEAVGEYINDNFPANTYPKRAEYYLDIFGSHINNEYQLNPLYENYSVEEMEELIDLVHQFSETFLIFNHSGNQKYEPRFLKPREMEFLTLPALGALSPGGSHFTKQVVQTVYHPHEKWREITIQVTMEAPNGEDISDYAVELLYDSAPFSQTQSPFEIRYRFIDPFTTYDRYVHNHAYISSVQAKIEFDSRVFKQNGEEKLYKHSYPKPTQVGQWSRFTHAPNYYLAANQRFLFNSSIQEGVILKGRADGRKVEMRFSMKNGVSWDGNFLPVFPIAVVITRGVAVDASGNPLPNQSSVMVEPIIKIKVSEESIEKV